MSNGSNTIGNLNGGWAWLLRLGLVLLPILSVSVGWLITEVISNGQAIAVIQSNRFTDEQGSDHERRITTLETRVPETFPPQDFMRRYDKLDTTVHAIEIRQEKMDATVNQIAEDVKAIKRVIE